MTKICQRCEQPFENQGEHWRVCPLKWAGTCKRCGQRFTKWADHNKRDCPDPLPWQYLPKPKPVVDKKASDQIAKDKEVKGSALDRVSHVRDKLITELEARTESKGKRARLSIDELMSLIKSCQSTIALEIEHSRSGIMQGEQIIFESDSEMFKTVEESNKDNGHAPSPDNEPQTPPE